MTNVLLSCVGRRHYLAEYFRVENRRGRVIGTDMSVTAPALYACDGWRQVSSVFSSTYLEELIQVVREEGIGMVFSLNDLESGLLVRNRSRLEQETGATIYVPSPETLAICADKWETYRFAREIGVRAPATFLSMSEALEAVKRGEIEFPLIVKPRWGSASIGLSYVHKTEELSAAFASCRAAVANTALSALAEEETVIIQEVISGPEYGVDLLYDKEERLLGFTAKRKLGMRAGETDKAITVPPDRFQPLVKKMTGALAHRGNLDCDFLERDGHLYLLELNPRFGGGYPFTHLAGANHVRMLLDDYEGRDPGPYDHGVGRTFAKADRLVEVSSPS